MVVAVIAVAAAAFAVVPGLAQAGTLDQQQTSISAGGHVIFPPFSNAQTFTAGIAGTLDQVDLHLYQSVAVDAPLTVQIRNAPGGLIGETVLASGSIGPGIGVGPPGGLVPIVFGSAPPVVAGNLYAIVVYSTSASGDYGWGYSAADPYPGGQAFQGTTAVPPTGASFAALAGEDFAFRTYVKPPAAATGLRAAALKKCKKKKSKKKRKKCRKRARKLPV